MKKLLTICLLIATAFTVNAQDTKPTKEETVDFINRTTAQSIGNQYRFGTLTETKFTYDSYSFTQTAQITDTDIHIQMETYSGILWESLNPEWIKKINVREGDATAGVSIAFSKKIKYEDAYTGIETKIEYKNVLEIIIPIEKFESVKKACLRLSEIAKEENKDPFAN